MLEQRQVTNILGSLARFAVAGRSSVASMPMVAVIAVAVSTLHGVVPKAEAGGSVLSKAGGDIAFAAPAQPGAADAMSGSFQGAAASADGAGANANANANAADGALVNALAEIERHLARAKHAAASREASPSSAPGANGAAPAAPKAIAGVSATADAAGNRASRQQEAGRAPLKLSEEQRNIAQFIASKYRVAVDDVQHFVAHAYRAASDFRLDPHLILAVVSVESSFNPNARSPKGAQGLMQVLTRVHTDKFAPFGGASAAFDPVANITVGSAILKEYLVREGSVEGALKSYVGAALLSHDFGYGRKVLSARERIAAAAQGQKTANAPAGQGRQAAARAIPEAARIAPNSGMPGETKTIPLFDLDAPLGKVDVSPPSSADLRGVDALAQLMDKLQTY